MAFSPSCSAAPDTSHSRTVRATSAAIRFCATSSGRNRSSSARGRTGARGRRRRGRRVRPAACPPHLPPLRSPVRSPTEGQAPDNLFPQVRCSSTGRPRPSTPRREHLRRGQEGQPASIAALRPRSCAEAAAASPRRMAHASETASAGPGRGPAPEISRRDSSAGGAGAVRAREHPAVQLQPLGQVRLEVGLGEVVDVEQDDRVGGARGGGHGGVRSVRGRVRPGRKDDSARTAGRRRGSRRITARSDAPARRSRGRPPAAMVVPVGKALRYGRTPMHHLS